MRLNGEGRNSPRPRTSRPERERPTGKAQVDTNHGGASAQDPRGLPDVSHGHPPRAQVIRKTQKSVVSHNDPNAVPSYRVGAPVFSTAVGLNPAIRSTTKFASGTKSRRQSHGLRPASRSRLAQDTKNTQHNHQRRNRRTKKYKSSIIPTGIQLRGSEKRIAASDTASIPSQNRERLTVP